MARVRPIPVARGLARTVAAMALAVALASAARASDEPHVFSIHGGATVPFARFADSTTTGFVVGLSLDQRVSRTFEVGADLAFLRPGQSEADGLSYSSLLVGVHGRIEPFGSAVGRPFLIAGAGGYVLVGQAIATALLGMFGIASGDVGLRGGVSGGVGMTLASGPELALGLEATAHHISNHTRDDFGVSRNAPIDVATIALRVSFVHAPRGPSRPPSSP